MNPGKRAALLAAAATAVTLFALGSGSAAAQQSENPCDQLVGNEELGPAGDIGAAGGELRPLCAIEVKKNVVTDKVQVGSTISFNIIITNVGTLPLTGVSADRRVGRDHARLRGGDRFAVPARRGSRY